MTIVESQAARKHLAGGQGLRRKSVTKVQMTDEYLYDAECAEVRGKAVPRVREMSADASAWGREIAENGYPARHETQLGWYLGRPLSPLGLEDSISMVCVAPRHRCSLRRILVPWKRGSD